MSACRLFFIIFLFTSGISFGQQPRLILPISEGEAFFGQFSPDGKKILTVSYFGPSRIWDAASGKILVDSLGKAARISFAIFQPGANRVLTCYYGDSARIWDLSTLSPWGKTIYHISGQAIVQFSPDGSQVIYHNPGPPITSAPDEEDSIMRVWDAATGMLRTEIIWKFHRVSFASYDPKGKPTEESKPLTAFLNEYSNELLHITCSQDAKKCITFLRDGGIKIWDLLTGRLIRTLPQHYRRDGSEQFSPEGSRLITFDSLNRARIWDTEAGSLLAEWQEDPIDSTMAFFSRDGNQLMMIRNGGLVHIREVNSGRLLLQPVLHAPDKLFLQFFSNGGAGKSYAVSEEGSHWLDDLFNMKDITPDLKIWDYFLKMILCSDGKKLLYVGKNDDKVTASAYVHDASGKILLQLKGHTSLISDCVFSPDGTKLITLGWDSVAQVRDVATGALLVDLRIYRCYWYPFNEEGTELLLLDGDSAVVVMDIATRHIIRRISRDGFRFSFAWRSRDGKRILTLAKGHNLMNWDMESGDLLNEIPGTSRYFSHQVNFSPDGKCLSVNSNDTLGIIDASNGKMLWAHPGIRGYPVLFGPDGTRILAATTKNEPLLLDVRSGQLIFQLAQADTTIRIFRFNREGNKILTVTKRDKIELWDGSTGKRIFDLSDTVGWNCNADFTRDGSRIITAPMGGKVRTWDTNTGKIISALNEISGYFSECRAALSPDGNTICTFWGSDNIFRSWDARSGNLLYKIWNVDSSDYLVVDRFNRYDGTEAARKLLYFVCGDEIVDLEQIKDQIWVPGLAERLAKGETINARTLDQLNICGLTPRVERMESASSDYSFMIKPQRGGLGETVVIINGIEVKRYKPAALMRVGGNYQLQLKKKELEPFFIAGKENPVVVKAYTSDNIISSRGAIVTADNTAVILRPPNLYAVMVGISDYKGTDLDLKYAAKDATDISNAISAAAKKLLNTDSSEHVFMYNLTTSEDHYLLPEKNSIKKVMIDIGKKATANDILLVFFAGHGIMTGAGSQKQFYFLTADASGFSATDAIRDVGISTTELIEWMKPQNIMAQKRILIFDACNSGQAINDFVKMGKEGQGYLAARNDDKSQQIKAIDKLNEKSGLFIFSASASNQSAYEMGRYSQGLLTYSLLKAIKQQPDILEDGKYLNVSRWFSAAERTVGELSKESGARQEPQIVSTTNFNIGIVDDEVLAKIILPTEKPLFASSNFQNSDEAIADDNLELGKLINNQLNDIASRGADSKIVFLAATNTQDAWSLSGRYDVKGNSVNVRINLKQNKEIKQRFELNGSKDNLKELAMAIAEKASTLVK